MEYSGRVTTSSFLKMLPLVALLFLRCEKREAVPQPEKALVRVAQIGIKDSLGNTVAQVTAEVAETAYQRSQGLMQREYLAVNEGMLFIFPDEIMRSFWMKNTLISLDLVFVNSHNRIVHIAENAEPLSTAPISSQYPAKYVLEVAGGYCREYGISSGCILNIVIND